MERKKWAKLLIIFSSLSMAASLGLIVALLYNYQHQGFVNQEGVVINNEIKPNIDVGTRQDYVLSCNVIQPGKMNISLSFSNTNQNSKYVYAALSYKGIPLFKAEPEVEGENISLVNFHCVNNYETEKLTDVVSFDEYNNELIFSLYVSNHYSEEKLEASFGYSLRITRTY